MNKSFLSYALVTVFLSLASRLNADDGQLQKALDAANAGQNAQAISLLEQLRSSTPSDARVLQRLGLLYQSERRYFDAVSALEGAVRIQPTTEALYALGLLYDEQLLSASEPQRAALKQKATEVWSALLRLVPDSDPRAGRARHHLKRLNTIP